jgi:hypothetical protein
MVSYPSLIAVEDYRKPCDGQKELELQYLRCAATEEGQYVYG